ncbi:MAG: YdcF family protein [Alphaproteobacteria bacterium]|nr:YdcF family protein [Alphaproteobacteria bacterium]MDE2341113.1 YdcF family protein [Alphaproteobacteria bacterium]
MLPDLPLFALCRWGALFALLLLVGIATFLTLYGLQDDVAPSDVVIILGTRVVDNGAPSPGLAARLDRGAALYKQGFAKHIIVSGGREPNGFVEAAVMRAYLVAHGVPAPAIFTEGRSKNTWENAQFSLAIMRAHHWQSAIITSEFFHIHRARWFFGEQGLSIMHNAGALSWDCRLPAHLFRETMANIYYALIGR